ncbi:MAG: ABC transporter permease [Chloroherpetonaceae bacterium]|nr:ABC transporter permease [Chthonomonadaceae bacterium]MDW8209221.1 ABC transporter permease [Chloroherpetonaceae bacterium]
MSGSSPGMTALREPVNPSSAFWRRLRHHRVALVCLLYVSALALIALLADVLAPYDYAFQDTRRYASLPAPPDARHLLGTDHLGRDLLSRLLHGARVSLTVSLVVVLISASIGITLGLIAGYRGGRTDLLLMRATDVMFAFPDLLFAILLSAIVRSGGTAVPAWLIFLTLFASLGLVAWPGMARLVRGQALALREREFVEAARAIGVRDTMILRRHLLPNLLGPVIVQVTQDVAGLILAEATLSFLGLGVPPPFASWGRMIFEALPYMHSHPMLLVYPGLALALTVMAFNFLGDALRDALDPRLRQ